MCTTRWMLATLGPVAVLAYRTDVAAKLGHQPPEDDADWHLVCQGYVPQEAKGRYQGLGHTKESHLGEAACRRACDAQGQCNFVTYDTLSGRCWMEKVQDRPTQCDNNTAGFSHYRGKDLSHLVPDSVELTDDAPFAVPMGWHYFCNGYLKDKRGRTGFGASPGKHQGVEACLAHCQRVTGCNFITYDSLQGVCWLEHIQGEPKRCDDNHAGVTYWHHDEDTEWSLAAFHFLDEPDGWHFVCTGYVTGGYGPGRRGLGSTEAKQLGQEGCKEACDAHHECNFVTYDSWKGVCWLEYHAEMPKVCDKNVAGWSYWRGLLDTSGAEEDWLKGRDWANDLGETADDWPDDLERDFDLDEWH